MSRTPNARGVTDADRRGRDPITLRLADLVLPSSPEAFLRDDWGRAARWFGGNVGEQAQAILDLPAFELLLGTLNRAHEGWLHLARNGRKPVPADMVDAEGMLDLARIRAEFQDGETLYLTKAHRVCVPLMHLCRAVEVDLRALGVWLRAPVSAHVFLTPPRSQGFPPHRDEHGSFILQLEGVKEWDVYEDVEGQNEPRRPGRVEVSVPPMAQHTFSLTAGDVLYIPEWWVHAARTSDEHSLHVTLRMFPLRWIDLLEAVLPHLSALDQAVPNDSAGTASRISDSLGTLLDSSNVRDQLPALVRRFLERTVVPVTPLPDDGFGTMLTVQQVRSTTWLGKAAGVACAVAADGGTATLAFPGGTLSGPAELETVFEYVAAADRFRAVDLPTARGEYDRTALARKLVLAGILKVEGTP
jgi:hypothetical protein